MRNIFTKTLLCTAGAAAFALPVLAVTAPSSGCAQVEIIGARGTGEPSGFGYLLTPIANDIQTNAKQTVGLYALPYPASADYEASEQEGVYDLENYLRTESTSCPNQTFVLLGYSQGAQVVGDALASSVLNTVAAKIVAITDFGDPAFNSAEAFDEGSYKKGVNGIEGPRKTGALNTYAKSIQNYCNGNDGICQAGQSLYGHLEYQTTAASLAEAYVLAKLGS